MYRQCNVILCSMFVFLLLTFFPFTSWGLVLEGDNLWDELKQDNHFVILRHALAPGTGDPSNFKLNDCSTQRNLSAEGRRQAERIGQLFRDRGHFQAQVYSSGWCRCVDTASLMGLGEVEVLPALNSFFTDFSTKDQQTRELREWLGGKDLSSLLILVTHQVNITALTGIFPRSGEMVVIERREDGELVVKGTITTD